MESRLDFGMGAEVEFRNGGRIRVSGSGSGLSFGKWVAFWFCGRDLVSRSGLVSGQGSGFRIGVGFGFLNRVHVWVLG